MPVRFLMIVLPVLAAVLALFVVIIALRKKRARTAMSAQDQGGGVKRTTAPGATARRPAESNSPKTMMMEMPGSPDVVASPGATVAMQWYGLLHCTGGPLDGQRFIVEEEGFYIGRDASLSKVVVDDARISKRHVRILPRDGKVTATDQDSTNGTFLNTSDSPRITEVTLKRGDTLILADDVATFKYQI